MDGLPVTITPPSLCTGSWPPGARKPVSDDGVETLVAVVVGGVDVVSGVDVVGGADVVSCVVVVAVVVVALSAADGCGATIVNCCCCCWVDALDIGPTVKTQFNECKGKI